MIKSVRSELINVVIFLTTIVFMRLLVLLQFFGGLRPAEGPALRARDLVPPWLHAEDPATIVYDPEAEERHFGRDASAHRTLAG